MSYIWLDFFLRFFPWDCCYAVWLYNFAKIWTGQIANEHAKGRPIIFSSFQPDAAQLMKKLQDTFPVSSLNYWEQVIL